IRPRVCAQDLEIVGEIKRARVPDRDLRAVVLPERILTVLLEQRLDDREARLVVDGGGILLRRDRLFDRCRRGGRRWVIVTASKAKHDEHAQNETDHHPRGDRRKLVAVDGRLFAHEEMARTMAATAMALESQCDRDTNTSVPPTAASSASPFSSSRTIGS